jgi:tetratricopeptide (TPR) repeat protein
MRTGRYDGAVEANVRAAAVDTAYIQKTNAQGVYPTMYYGHNLQFLSVAAGMDGRSAQAVKAADDLAGTIPPGAIHEMPMAELVLPLTFFSRARFGMWDGLLALPAPPADQHYMTAFWHWGRAIASAAKGRFDEADKERGAFAAASSLAPPDILLTLNTSGALLRLAGTVLDGEIAARRGRTDEGIARLREAMKLEDALSYDEPPPWYVPVRQALGAVLVSTKRYAEAEKVYDEDLRIYPENGWSLFGLAQCLKARNAPEAADVQKRFEKAWTKADVKLASSAF